MNKDTYTAVVPVRAGSRRLKNKNIFPFSDTNLLIHKIRQLKQVKAIDQIVVSSDSDLMLKMADDENVNTHKRTIEYCDEKTKTFGEVVRHICQNVSGDNVIWATCTSPLVTPSIYDQAILAYKNGICKGFDSLMSVQTLKRYVWNESGPINYELGIKHVPSQELPELYIVTDGILIAKRQKMIEWAYFHGPNPLKFPMEKNSAVDVDDLWDLACAKAWFELEKRSIFNKIVEDGNKGSNQ